MKRRYIISKACQAWAKLGYMAAIRYKGKVYCKGNNGWRHNSYENGNHPYKEHLISGDDNVAIYK